MSAARQPRVAIIGAGISGLGAARALSATARVTVYEAGSQAGGHAHTRDVTLEGITHGVDTGFLVFNHRTYPRLKRLFEQLEVPTAPSDMSFSVQEPASGLEWCGSDLNSVFAQRRNLVRPAFWAMLADLMRFNRLCTGLAVSGEAEALQQPLGEFLEQHRFGDALRDWYLLPMLGCIWSCPTDQMLRFPVATMIRFCHNHGLIQVTDRPQWHTVAGGSREYVRRIVQSLGDVRLGCPVRAIERVPPGTASAGVWVVTEGARERFDEVVLACHSDQALALLGPHASPAERQLLGAIRYQPNDAVLHTDAALLPRTPRAWAAWNFERAADAGGDRAGVCLHYLINRLQPLPWQQPVIVSMNPVREPDPAKVIHRLSYAHPVFDGAAIAAQQRLGEIQGQAHVWFAGAWLGYGFHEDGLKSGLEAACALQARWSLQHDPAQRARQRAAQEAA